MTDPTHHAPIEVPCEGSGFPTHDVGVYGMGVCSMCGELVDLDRGDAVPHQRDDVLARLDRGDFND